MKSFLLEHEYDDLGLLCHLMYLRDGQISLQTTPYRLLYLLEPEYFDLLKNILRAKTECTDYAPSRKFILLDNWELALQSLPIKKRMEV